MPQDKEKGLICPLMSRASDARELIEVKCRDNCVYYKDDRQYPCRLLGALYAITFGRKR